MTSIVPHADERGSITTMFAVLAVFLFGIISLVSEGNRKLSNVSQAEDLAAEAARAAAATLDVADIAAGYAAIDEGRAEALARGIVELVDGAELEQFGVSDGGESVTVVVRLNAESWIPGFDLDGVGRHRAVALDPFAP